MNPSSKPGTAVLHSIAIPLLGTGSSSHAQVTPSSFSIDEHLVANTGPNPVATPDSLTKDRPADDPAPSGSPQVASPGNQHSHLRVGLIRLVDTRYNRIAT
jgi:hypothetical protein